MIFFYVLLLVPIMSQHFSFNGVSIYHKEKNKRALGFFFCLFTVLVMFRHKTVGADTQSYIYYFESIANTPWGKLSKYPLDIGYVYLNKVISLITTDYQVFLAVVAIITICMMYPTYKRLCVDSSLTIVLFCTMSTFVMMFSGIRQMLAVGIGFFAYEFTRNKKLIPFIITVIAAICFHASGFILAVMYPLYHVKITKNWLLVVVPALVLVFVFNTQIFLVLSIFLERYTDYDAAMTQTGAYTMLILFAAFAVFAFLVPDESRIDSETIGLRNLLLLALVLQMFSPLHTIAMRMNYYYIVFIPLLLPKIVECRSERWGEFAIVGRHIMVAFFLMYFFLYAYTGYTLKVFPYHFFWENIL